MISKDTILKKNQILLGVLGVFVLLSCQLQVNAQQKPPTPISVSYNPAEGLRFGAFFQSPSGGEVIISASGTRMVTGGVIEADMGYAYGSANFEITANPGTLISIVNGPNVVLSGSNGGTMTLHIGSSSPASPLITSAVSPAQTSVNIGGTLTVGSAVANPSGSYSGSFVVIFMQN